MEKSNVILVGVFDLFHEGHLNLIKNASKMGNVYVGVVCDKAVKSAKGENRPVHNEKFRLDLVSNLKQVKFAKIISDFDIYKFCNELFNNRFIATHIAIKGEDQNHIKGFDKLQKDGILVITLPRTEGVSTSDTVKKLGVN